MMEVITREAKEAIYEAWLQEAPHKIWAWKKFLPREVWTMRTYQHSLLAGSQIELLCNDRCQRVIGVFEAVLDTMKNKWEREQHVIKAVDKVSTVEVGQQKA